MRAAYNEPCSAAHCRDGAPCRMCAFKASASKAATTISLFFKKKKEQLKQARAPKKEKVC